MCVCVFDTRVCVWDVDKYSHTQTLTKKKRKPLNLLNLPGHFLCVCVCVCFVCVCLVCVCVCVCVRERGRERETRNYTVYFMGL